MKFNEVVLLFIVVVCCLYDCVQITVICIGSVKFKLHGHSGEVQFAEVESRTPLSFTCLLTQAVNVFIF